MNISARYMGYKGAFATSRMEGGFERHYIMAPGKNGKDIILKKFNTAAEAHQALKDQKA